MIEPLARTKVTKLNLSQIVVLVLILAAGLIVRLWQIDTPLADWHSWRQADTASVTHQYLVGEHSLLEPRYHDLSNIPSGLENPEGYRMVEFPLVNYSLAQILKLSPSLDLVVISRLASIFFSLISTLALAVLVLQIGGSARVALLSAAFFAFLPFSVFYSRVILPEPAMVMASLVALTFFVIWLRSYGSGQRSHFWWLLLTWTFLSLSFLLKPVALFMAPAFLILSWSAFGVIGMIKQWPLWLLATSVLPLWWWREHITHFPAGIPASDWLFNGNGIRLKPAWWRWLIGERLGEMILGYFGSSLLVLGLIPHLTGAKSAQISLQSALTLALTLGWFSYLVVFATGNVQHDYYQIPLIMVVALLLARGTALFYDLMSEKTGRLLALASTMAILGLSLFLSFDSIRGFYNINNPAIVAAGLAAKELTPESAKIIAPYQGDTAFLFQTLRQGWPIGGEIEHKIELGATHYLTTTMDDEANDLIERFQIIKQTDDFLLLDLTTPLDGAQAGGGGE